MSNLIHLQFIKKYAVGFYKKVFLKINAGTVWTLKALSQPLSLSLTCNCFTQRRSPVLLAVRFCEVPMNFQSLNLLTFPFPYM